MGFFTSMKDTVIFQRIGVTVKINEAPAYYILACYCLFRNSHDGSLLGSSLKPVSSISNFVLAVQGPSQAFFYVGFLRRLYANCSGTPTYHSMWWNHK